MASASFPTLNSLRLSPSPLLIPKSKSFPRLPRPLSTNSLAFERFPPLKPSPSRILLAFSPEREKVFLSRVAKNGGREVPESTTVDKADAARGQSTLPEWFRHQGSPRLPVEVTVGYRYIYSSIVAFAPVPELTRIILFTSTILAIAEATVPDSVNSQPHLLKLSGISGLGLCMALFLSFFFG